MSYSSQNLKDYRDIPRIKRGIKLDQIAKVGEQGIKMVCECGDIKTVCTKRRWAWVECPCSIQKLGYIYYKKHEAVVGAFKDSTAKRLIS